MILLGDQQRNPLRVYFPALKYLAVICVHSAFFFFFFDLTPALTFLSCSTFFASVIFVENLFTASFIGRSGVGSSKATNFVWCGLRCLAAKRKNALQVMMGKRILQSRYPSCNEGSKCWRPNLQLLFCLRKIYTLPQGVGRRSPTNTFNSAWLFCCQETKSTSHFNN